MREGPPAGGLKRILERYEEQEPRGRENKRSSTPVCRTPAREYFVSRG